MRDKLLNLMKSENLTSSRLAEILEVQPSGISHILSGRNKPGFELLQKLLRRFPRINPDWLLLDSDQMFRTGDSDVTTEHSAHQSPNAELFSQTEIGNGNSDSSVAAKSTATNSVSKELNLGERASVAKTRADVERVVIFYSDKTFDTYTPKQE